ncbi:MAG TPA: flavin reductase family protein [Acidimicrobiales bacterium]|nr:flavin reductase family protein [Acidimicrobiales bacterium]
MGTVIFDPGEHPPDRAQGLLSSVIVPRPIAMITTSNTDGTVNVAPFSYFMPVTGHPPLLAVTMGGRQERMDQPKDTWSNTSRTGEFVVNVTVAGMAEHIETAAIEFPYGVSELDVLGWHTVPSVKVAHPSLAESPVHLECRVHRVVDLGDAGVAFSTVHLVIAEVVCITLDDAVCTGPFRVDPDLLQPVGRMTFPQFVHAHGGALFALERVSWEQFRATAEGQAR